MCRSLNPVSLPSYQTSEFCKCTCSLVLVTLMNTKYSTKCNLYQYVKNRQKRVVEFHPWLFLKWISLRSTQPTSLHVRGPVGSDKLTSCKSVTYGDGHLRG
ncbi:hypothetical protein CRENPOLYSF1_1570005 [Crenothrix polyspora]|uniref:Uncharacterized protein n=1 Tax=Crenothrix polyspora TaxID=360316 RepID=A0A1R4H3J6_9GAMM|nr:hypothetical protein CRENPOLYSF1_1570005 [Crenothrix polyspora]